ncbi:MAG: ADP-ribosylglycohydrolase family protein [Acetobacteraceae bacterium]|nr:ADP-ribosylglycohydrolase family protein [Acetobacteraceae bacterium]
MTSAARIRGCLLGGAVGDALGAAVEFDSLAAIRARFGATGLADYASAYGRRGTITDDTQMTLFSAEGLLRAWVRGGTRGVVSIPMVVQHAYLRWLLTQGERPASGGAEIGRDGWLFAVRGLHSRRAPGNTCLGALRIGRDGPPVAANDSKGCGAVMRAAPFGLFAPLGDLETVFRTGAEAGALTHGHPSGFLSAGHLAATIAGLRDGLALRAALSQADAILRCQPDHAETSAALSAAYRLAERGPPTPEALETLGGGWVGEEALAIAVCCALTAADFADGVLRAVNHSGDSDSTGAIAGNLLGTLSGESTIPARWLDGLELRAEITRLADDLVAGAVDGADPEAFAADYPGW